VSDHEASKAEKLQAIILSLDVTQEGQQVPADVAKVLGLPSIRAYLRMPLALLSDLLAAEQSRAWKQRHHDRNRVKRRSKV
jgi:hypothetical protein